jgi:hypothetical protein
MFLLISKTVYADIDLSITLHCSYQKGQFLSKTESDNIMNSVPLNWTFNGLNSDKSLYVSGGDTGQVLTVPIENGYSIYLPFGTGSHSFTIWKTGESIWNKQAKLAGVVNSQQYLGSCNN